MSYKPIMGIGSAKWDEILPQIPDEYPISRIAIEGQEAYPAPDVYTNEGDSPLPNHELNNNKIKLILKKTK